MKPEQIRQLLEQLDWGDGLTRQEVMRRLQPIDDSDVDLESLYLALEDGRKYFGVEEAVDSIPETYWEP